jgi:hypothetical protein
MSVEYICLQGFVLLMIALYGATTPQTPSLLRTYFIVQALYAVFLFGAQLFVSRSSSLFHVLYALFTSAMLSVVCAIAIAFAARHERTFTVLFVALLVSAAPSWMAVEESRPHNLAGWVHIAEGATLLSMGLLAGMSAPFLYWAHRKVAVTLATMWVLLGMFREGYWLHWSSAPWSLLDEWVPWLVTVAGMGTAARLMHRYSNFLAQPRSGAPSSDD